MPIGGIRNALLNSLGAAVRPGLPEAEADPAQVKPAEPAGSQAGPQDEGPHDGQLRAMLDSIDTLQQHAGADGAGIFLSSSGTALKDAVTGFGHLLGGVSQAAGDLVGRARGVIAKVEGRLAEAEAAGEQMAQSRNFSQSDQDRLHRAEARYRADMDAAMAQIRASLDRLGR